MGTRDQGDESRVEIRVPEAIPADAIQRLATGAITVLGRMPNASNATFLVRLDDPDGLAIYKPERGEQPLWDFPSGLYRRETAAWLLSEATGLHVIPPTVTRQDAPLGTGSLQWFINADFTQHYFSLYQQYPDLHTQLMALAVFDIVANNTDRKSGHCLFEPATKTVWGIDNGLCFSTSTRLRTVIWDFAGTELSEPLKLAVWALAEQVPDAVADLLDPDETAAISERARVLARRATLPHDRTGRAYPWPLV
jgi:uncharacterized repeat protein (TIGR03843 family)